jgi:hypothetical protein
MKKKKNNKQRKQHTQHLLVEHKLLFTLILRPYALVQTDGISIKNKLHKMARFHAVKSMGGEKINKN